MYSLEIFQREEYFDTYTDGELYRICYFVIHTEGINIYVFETKTVDNNIILYVCNVCITLLP